jgi:hypothetical protein
MICPLRRILSTSYKNANKSTINYEKKKLANTEVSAFDFVVELRLVK